MRNPAYRVRCVLALAMLASTFGLVTPAVRSQSSDHAPLKHVADVPLPGPAVRFDYQSLDTSQGRLYIAHMNANQLVVFDTKKRVVIANLDGFPSVHGVLAVSELGRVYASVTGEHKVAAVGMATLKTIAKVGPINYPDGIAYAPDSKRVFVSDEHGDADAVIDTKTNFLVTSIPLGGAGNTVYDSGSGSGHILVAVHEKNELGAIHPATAKIIGRYAMTGIESQHGIALDVAERLAFVAGEENQKLAVVDLTTMKVLATHSVGEDPDVLAFDPGLKRLYVSAESGNVAVLRERGKTLVSEGGLFIPHAHTVCVDRDTDLVFFPCKILMVTPSYGSWSPPKPIEGSASRGMQDQSQQG
jgi:DNA-binding beta-propeller fold protein YncE